jgi:hypothetical protein
MSASFTKIQQLAVGIVSLVFGALLAGATSGAKTREAGDDVKLVRTEKLANAPGQTLTAKASLNRPAASISSARMRARRSRPACWLFSSPMTERN